MTDSFNLTRIVIQVIEKYILFLAWEFTIFYQGFVKSSLKRDSSPRTKYQKPGNKTPDIIHEVSVAHIIAFVRILRDDGETQTMVIIPDFKSRHGIVPGVGEHIHNTIGTVQVGRKRWVLSEFTYQIFGSLFIPFSTFTFDSVQTSSEEI